jgi:hypothetical protein
MTAFQDSPAVYLKLVDVSYGPAAACDFLETLQARTSGIWVFNS